VRLEYKYLVPNERLDELRQGMRPFVQTDRYAETGNGFEYTVRSIYFDNCRMQHYNDKIDGAKVRKKVRVRGYNRLESEDTIYLEIKRRLENHVFKDRAPLQFRHLAKVWRSRNVERYILQDPEDAQAVPSAQKFFYNICRNEMSPVLLIVYDREAFYSKFDGGLRITFDKNMRQRRFPALQELGQDTALWPVLQKHFILELKFSHGYPRWMQSLIRRLQIQRLALSKYAICLDSNRRSGITATGAALPAN